MGKLTAWDRLIAWVSPQRGLTRARYRAALELMERHYEAASRGRRTSGWDRNFGDANTIVATGLVELRLHARALVRNNAWARKGQRTIANNTAGWGLVPKAIDENPGIVERATELWKSWADSVECDADGRNNFSGQQHLCMKTIPESGEVLLRRRWRREADGLTIPMQIQIMEPDFLDHNKTEATKTGSIKQGVQFDKLGRRVGYWLFDAHPGSGDSSGESFFVPARDIIHAFYMERPGQSRGVSWFGAAIVPLKDFDEYEDATLLRQKIAACFAAFKTDLDGLGTAVGEEDADDAGVETLEPGMIHQLRPGEDIRFANPPTVADDKFTERNLRRIAAALGVPYEDLTGDYSQVNFSSARMARISHYESVKDWRWNMLVPQICDGVWRWAMEAAVLSGLLESAPKADWTAPPMPMIEPDKEGLAYSRLIRNGIMTLGDAIREQGGDLEAHLQAYAAEQKRLDELKIKLDCDVRAVSAAGLTQERIGGGQSEKEPPDETERALNMALTEQLRGIQ